MTFKSLHVIGKHITQWTKYEQKTAPVPPRVAYTAHMKACSRATNGSMFKSVSTCENKHCRSNQNLFNYTVHTVPAAHMWITDLYMNNENKLGQPIAYTQSADVVVVVSQGALEGKQDGWHKIIKKKEMWEQIGTTNCIHTAGRCGSSGFARCPVSDGVSLGSSHLVLQTFCT